VPKLSFRPATTDAGHGWRVWPNLARHLVPMAVNQLWVADITYIRLREEFVYLAVVLDAFSRRMVGWAMAEQLRTELALSALDLAIGSRDVTPGALVHHSDQGVQYACGDYIARLQHAGIQPSMSRPGCPWDNAMAESFMRTLKREEVNGQAYRDRAEAEASIGAFIEAVYNGQHLHSALAYLAPEEFEAGHAPCVRTVAAYIVTGSWGRRTKENGSIRSEVQRARGRAVVAAGEFAGGSGFTNGWDQRCDAGALAG